MKNTKKITRIRLEENQPNESIIVGIVSSEPDYKLSLLLNKKFRISLKHNNPVNIPGTEAVSFSRFASFGHGLNYSLVANRSEKEFLLKKLRNIDYFFIVNDPGKEIDADKLAADLREMESISAVFRIEPENIGSKIIQYLIH